MSSCKKKKDEFLEKFKLLNSGNMLHVFGIIIGRGCIQNNTWNILYEWSKFNAQEKANILYELIPIFDSLIRDKAKYYSALAQGEKKKKGNLIRRTGGAVGDEDMTPEIKYAKIRILVDELGQAVANRIDRDLRDKVAALHPNLSIILKLTVKVARVTWQSIKFLCADRSPARREEFVLSVPPLSRTIVDSIFTTVFVFDDPAARTKWFLESIWRDGHSEYERLSTKYSGDPEWDEYLKKYDVLVDQMRCDAGLPVGAQPNCIQWWPNPGKMVRVNKKNNRPQYLNDQRRHAFLSFLNDWYYGPLSGQAHLSGTGFMLRAGKMVEQQSDTKTTLYNNKTVREALVLYVTLLTELVCQLDMDHQKNHARTIWTELCACVRAKEIWQLRYDDWLGGK